MLRGHFLSWFLKKMRLVQPLRLIHPLPPLCVLTQAFASLLGKAVLQVLSR